MNSLFSVGVKYLKLADNGEGYKKKNDVRLVHAESFTDAEAKITEEMIKITKEEFVISSIKREKYSYVLTNDEDGGYYFNVVISYSSIDDDSEKPKKISLSMLIETSNVDNVSDIVCKVLDGTVDYSITKVNLTKIVDVIQ